MPILIPCKCGYQISAPERLSGRTLRCPKCLGEFTVPNAPPAPPPPPMEFAPMEDFAPSIAALAAAEPPPREFETPGEFEMAPEPSLAPAALHEEIPLMEEPMVFDEADLAPVMEEEPLVMAEAELTPLHEEPVVMSDDELGMFLMEEEPPPPPPPAGKKKKKKADDDENLFG